MAKILTEKQLYKAKVEWFHDNEYEEVDPLAFYREIFPVGSFQDKGHTERKAGNGMLIYKNEHGQHWHKLIFDDLTEIPNWYGVEDVYIRSASFIGKNTKNENASMIYALVFDLDGQGITELQMVTQFMRKGTNIPKATFVVLSGHGLHLYYVLETPIRATMNNIRKLNKLKEGMTKLIWNRYTSNIDKIQFQYCLQGFRMVGSASKMGKRYPVRAFRFSDEHYTIEELVSWIPKLKEWDEYRIDITERDTVPKETAKKLWPEWYEYRINQRQSNKWHIKRDLYDWWKNKIVEGATYGHRYFCIMCLAIFAIKCDISEEELKRDALELVPILDRVSNDKDPKSRFTEDDVLSALHGYRENFKTWGRDKLALVSAIPMAPNKRNYRTRAEHLVLARGIKDIKKKMGEVVEGRPKGSGTKKEIIVQWKLEHPTGRKADCHRDTGIDPKTIRKWWDN